MRHDFHQAPSDLELLQFSCVAEMPRKSDLNSTTTARDAGGTATVRGRPPGCWPSSGCMKTEMTLAIGSLVASAELHDVRQAAVTTHTALLPLADCLVHLTITKITLLVQTHSQH